MMGMSWLALFPAATFGLGIWQVYRLQWKLDLIQKVSEKRSKPSIPLEDVR